MYKDVKTFLLSHCLKKRNLKIVATFKRKLFVSSSCILRIFLYVIFAVRKYYFKIYF